MSNALSSLNKGFWSLAKEYANALASQCRDFIVLQNTLGTIMTTLFNALSPIRLLSDIQCKESNAKKTFASPNFTMQRQMRPPSANEVFDI